MIPYPTIWDTQVVGDHKSCIGKEVVVVEEGEIVLSSIGPETRVRSRPFPTREYIYEFEIKCTCGEDVLREVAFPVVISGMVRCTGTHGKCVPSMAPTHDSEKG